MIIADSTAERYAAVMNNLIADCTRLEDRVADLEAQLQATAQARDAAIAAQTAAERERDQAVQDLEEIEGTFGEEDLAPADRVRILECPDNLRCCGHIATVVSSNKAVCTLKVQLKHQPSIVRDTGLMFLAQCTGEEQM
eukprot:COSAG03_NODE_2439_length_2765_cov_4.412228_2_plen_139_part_00